MHSSRAEEWVYCLDCHHAMEVLLDHATDDTICTNCALILDAHYVDEDVNAGGDHRDPCRVGSTDNPFLDAKLSTIITYSKKPKTKSSATGEDAPPKMSAPFDAGSASDRTLVDGFHGIADMADRRSHASRRSRANCDTGT